MATEEEVIKMGKKLEKMISENTTVSRSSSSLVVFCFCFAIYHQKRAARVSYALG